MPVLLTAIAALLAADLALHALLLWMVRGVWDTIAKAASPEAREEPEEHGKRDWFEEGVENLMNYKVHDGRNDE